MIKCFVGVVVPVVVVVVVVVVVHARQELSHHLFLSMM